MTSNETATAAPSWKTAVRGTFLAMGLVSLFTDFSPEMLNPLLPIFIAGLVGGAKAATLVGLMEGIAETTAAILKIFSGRISDKTGRRKALVVLGYGLSSISRPFFALVTVAAAGVQVVALKFLDRVGKGIRTSPRDALIGDSVPKEVRGLAFSFHRVMDHVGAILGPVVAIGILYFLLGGAGLWGHPAIAPGSEVAGVGEQNVPAVGAQEILSLRWLFAVAVVPGVFAMAAAIFKVREIHPPAPSGGKQFAGAWAFPKKFYAYVGIVTLFALGNSSDMFIVFLAATRFHLSMGMVLVLWIVLHISKIFFTLPGGVLSDKIGRRPIIISGWIMYALVYLGFAFANPDAQWQFWALILAYGFYYGMTEGVEKALVADFVPSDAAARRLACTVRRLALPPCRRTSCLASSGTGLKQDTARPLALALAARSRSPSARPWRARRPLLLAILLASSRRKPAV